jgi:acyl-CoA reductase-like NAD-dependent aldehyde dehydrogenase
MDYRLMHRREFYIDGGWVAPAGGEMAKVISPSTEEVVGEYAIATDADMDRAVGAARRAFDESPWPRLAPTERAEILVDAVELLKKRESDLVSVLVEEIGTPVSQIPLSLGFVGAVFDYYAHLAKTYAFERQVANGPAAGLVAGEPVGVVGAIVPWNAPVTLAAWKIAPALVAGCTVVCKPPPETPLSTFVLAEVLDEAGLPPGVLNVVPGGREVGEHLVTHTATDKIAFTGSTAAGKRIMSLCGAQVKRVSLELGGKSATLLLEDADLATIIPRLVHVGMHQSGQVCAMQSRVLVHRSRYDEAVDLAAAATADVITGDPHDPESLVGPLIAERQRARVEGYIQLAVEAGAAVACGGGRPAHLPKGWYVQPTVLARVDNGMRVAQEEIFGPVLSFIAHDGDDDGVRIANDSPFGLAAGVWSADDERALAVARRVRAGTVGVNGFGAPLPLAPFGGFKESGLGRELGPEGLAQYLETKSIGLPQSLVNQSG